MITYNTLGRLLCKTHPEIALAAKRRYHPMLVDKKFSAIPEVIKYVDGKYPDLEQFDRNVLIAACVYSLYCPASLLGGRCQNAPANMRKAVADALGYENGTNVNYWQDKARTFVKAERYITKVADITEHFKPRSVNPADWELAL